MIFLSKEQRQLKRGLVKCKNHFIRTFRPRYDEIIKYEADKFTFYQKSIDLRERYIGEFSNIFKEIFEDFEVNYLYYINLINDFVNTCLNEYISVIKGSK